MSDGYQWRGSEPTDNPTLEWDRTFGQRKAHLAKRWDELTEHHRKVLIEKMLYYSAIHEVQEL